MLHPRSVGEADKVAQRIIVPLPSAYPDMIGDRAVAVRIDRLLAAIETARLLPENTTGGSATRFFPRLSEGVSIKDSPEGIEIPWARIVRSMRTLSSLTVRLRGTKRIASWDRAGDALLSMNRRMPIKPNTRVSPRSRARRGIASDPTLFVLSSCFMAINVLYR